METPTYKKINAFTSPTSSGNPAACLYLDDGPPLPDDVMLAIAKEHKGFVAEVVYCRRLAPAFYELRYFSSECEVDFCGHGTIACMYALIKNDGALADIPEVSIRTLKGDLVVYNEIQALDAVFITAPDKKECPVLAEAEDIARSLGIGRGAMDAKREVACIDAGNRTLIVPIQDLETILAVSPDESALKNFCLKNDVDIILLFTTDVVSSANKIRTRVFAPKFGYLEDVATGSGNAAMGHYMRQHGMWDGEAISIEQNKERDAYNVVKLKERAGKVLFGGRAATTIEGRYLL